MRLPLAGGWTGARTVSERIRAIWVVTVLALLVTMVAGLLGPAPVRASVVGEPILTPAPNASAYDDARDLLYVAAGDRILRYDAVTEVQLSPIVVGGSISDIDISPDGAQLLAAESYAEDLPTFHASDYPSLCSVHVVDLDSLAIRRLQTPVLQHAMGVRFAKWGPDGTFVALLRRAGYAGWDFFRVDPRDNTWAPVGSAHGNDSQYVAPAKDHTVVAGSSFRYRFSPSLLVLRTTPPLWPGLVCTTTDRIGKMDVVTSQLATYLLDTSIDPSAPQVTGPGMAWAQYGQADDVLFTVSMSLDQLNICDSTTLAINQSIPLPERFARLPAVGSPGLTLLSDEWDAKLWIGTISGIRPVGLKPTVQGVVHSSAGSAPVEGAQVELWQQCSGLWFAVGRASTGPEGTWRYAPPTDAAVRVRVLPGSDQLGGWIGGASLDSASDIHPALSPAIVETTVTPTALASLGGVVRAEETGQPLSGITVAVAPVASPSATVTAAPTDASGSFHFDGLPPGRYSLLLRDPSGEHMELAYAPGTAAGSIALDAGIARSLDCTMGLTPYRLHGTVLCEFQSEPVLYATIEAWARGTDGLFHVVGTSRTDGSGRYSLSVATSAPVRLRVSDPSGFSGVFWHGGTDVTDATAVSVSRDDTAAEQIVAPLTHPAVFSGTVRDGATGRVLPFARIEIVSYYVAFSSITYANADGTYRAPFRPHLGYDSTPYYVRITDADGRYTVTEGGPFWTLPPDAQCTFNGYVWYLPAYLVGTVRSAFCNSPVQGAQVQVWSPDASATWSPEATLVADSNGSWSLSHEDTPTLKVRVIDPAGFHDPVWIGGTDLVSASDFRAARHTPTRADVTMPLDHPATVAGTAVSSKDGTRVPDALVVLFSDVAPSGVASTTVTDASGRYCFTGLDKGTYWVAIVDQYGAHDYWECAAGIAVGSPGAYTCDATLTYIPTSVSGAVISDSGAIAVGGAIVELFERGGSGWSVVASGAADEFGWFDVVYDAPGPVRVSVSDPTGMHDPYWYGGASAQSAADVTPGRLGDTWLDIKMHLATPAHVGGTVVSDYSGAPLAGVTVQLLTAVDGYPAFETTTSVTGAYVFGNVPCGDYVVGFMDPSGRYAEVYAGGALDPWSATVVRVTTPEARTCDVRMSPVQDGFAFDVTSQVSVYGTGAWVGEPLRLRTGILDGSSYQPVCPGLAYLESSTDGATWTRTSDAPRWLGDGLGTIEATVTPTTTAAIAYRFTIPGSEFLAAWSSEPTWVAARVDRSSFSPIAIQWDPANGYEVPAPGWTLRLGSVLLGVDGAPDVVSSVRLQTSSDGVNFTDAAVPVGGTTSGLRAAATRLMQRTYYRFVCVSKSHGNTFYSAVAVFAPHIYVTIRTSATRVAYPRAFVLSGVLQNGLAGEPCIVEVQKPGSSRWSYSSARLVYMAGPYGTPSWWYRYTPRLRGTYRFRVRYNGGVAGMPCLSGTIAVTIR